MAVHYEEPHHPPSSVRQFLSQYAMIVLSILTALALERVAVSINNTIAARDSKVRIEAELAHNLSELKDSEEINLANVTRVKAASHALIDQIKAGKPNDAAMLALAAPGFSHLDFASPSWERDAWDSAIADQTASHLDPADLQRYAEIYADERDMESTEQFLLGGDWLSRATELGIDTRLGKVDGLKIVNVMARYLVAAQQMEEIQKDLITLITTGHQRRTLRQQAAR
jgi:hypothetical protein